MSIQNDLSVSPYFDDYKETSDYYKILFRPGVSVQARELNQLQTLLQKQIERFGDNIFKTGTIISGCDIAFHNDLKYVKIKDIEVDSTPVVVSSYAGYRVKNQNNIIPLTAAIIKTNSGFESKKPNLNTLYLRYINSGTDSSGTKTSFESGETLTVFNPLNVIEKITVSNASKNFLDTDKVVILSAIAIQNANNSKTFATSLSSGDYITNGTANVQIIAAPDSNTLSDALILQIKPRKQDLHTGNSKGWTFSVGDSIEKVGASGEIIKISQILGTGASASITTDNLSQVKSINVGSKGTGYTVLPSVTISSTKASENDINLFSATAQNYLTKITIASDDNPTGSTYGMTVGEGVIYQKGYFSRVSEQLLIVEKYNNTPDQKSVGFQTVESIVSSNQDESLLDNATGSPNYTAPGANRLKLTPQLTVIDRTKSDVPDDFLYIAEFSAGEPYKQNRQTVYNIIEKDIAQRSFETAGNYVLDPFLVNSKSPNSFSDESTKFNVLIDPGTAYINGNRVQTVYNYEQSIDKGVDTIVAPNTTISMNYGNYVYVNELAGVFDFDKSRKVNLYPTAKKYLTNERGDFTPTGSPIGTARIRSVIHDSGVPGTPAGVYRIYLYDIRMNSGYNFKSVRSMFYGARDSVCDLVLENGNAVLKDASSSSLIFYAGADAIKNITNISYIYRTNTPMTLSNTGLISFATSGGTSFPYSGTLSSTLEKEFTIIPSTDITASVNLTGTISMGSGSNVVIGNTTTSNTIFTQDLLVGDYIKFNGIVKQITKISNNSLLYLSGNGAGQPAITNNVYSMHFPANVAISFARPNRTISVTSGSLTINLGTTCNSGEVTVTHNLKSGVVNPALKTVNRDKYVRLRLLDNLSSNTGPWALGVSDVFRLNKVFKGPNTTFKATASDTVFDVTNDYYIDHNQNEDYYGISYLYKKPNTRTLTDSDYLLVSFDYITSASGVKVYANSIILNDSITLSQSVNTINTLEIPEVYGVTGAYYDLRDQIDFRPITNNSVTPSSSSLTAPINPTEPLSGQIIKVPDVSYYFPAPDSYMTADIEYYLPRSDRVIVDDTNEFRVIKGTPGTTIAPEAPDNSLTLNILKIPPYPSVPYTLSANTTKFADTGIANEKFTTRRIRNYRITTTLSDNDISVLQPRNYTMGEISKLENRISTLEYYASLSLVETLTQKRDIPSSLDSNVDRYKFGFYVDGFEDYTHSDMSNPGYRAAIVDGYLAPSVSEFNINTSTPSSDVSLSYLETAFISQKKATDGPVVTTVVKNPVTTQAKVCIIQGQRNISASDSAPYVYDEFFYTFGTESDTFDFYMVSPYGKTAVEVYQSPSVLGPWSLVTSSQYGEAITNGDVAKNKLDESLGIVLHPGTLTTIGTGPVTGGWILDQHKLSGTHNPVNGLYYKIRVYKGVFYTSTNIYTVGNFGTAFKYKMCYPTNAEVNVINTNDTTNYQMNYGGHIKSLYGGPGERERFVVRNV